MSGSLHDLLDAPRRPRPAGRRAFGGTVDLLLVALAVLAVLSRTPVGGLAWYAWERAGGDAAELPSLTAFFDSGAIAPLDLETLPVLPEDSGHVVVDGGVPEPWRTAARAVLSADLPPAAADALAARPELEGDAAALLDALYAESGDAEVALEELVLGREQRERAVARARAAGEPEAERYAGHRRYLPGAAARRADRVVGGALALATVLDLSWPVRAPHRITSPYGWRDHPVLGTRKLHNGVDIGIPVGTPVHAVQGGRVAVVGENDASGRYVVLDHGHGVRTAYCHLDEALREAGAEVARDEAFARSGNTGRSTGPHLHYIVRIAGETVDPMRFHAAPEGS